MPKEAKPKKEKVTKKKDPHAPKKALSPYMFFTQEWREKIKDENPGIGFGEVAKRLGAKWKSMTDEEKEPYVQKHQADKKRADDEKEAYEGKSKAAAAASGDDEDDD
ncbi:SubName: Full=NHP6A-Nonhistone chromosomal protein related to mammalian HMG1 {ECO:0000313/EMBL:CCA71859.1} [Serendipita indica DSM 11827]|uniref:NHP6A-Nonhistone chromosomal protein related to mammalian HMG1 n=1 Tax=Serendipita indica (strain DSM 11827) TaxID=1109443 RepID=G4TKL2_SERID|nr:SubName: Full=NHP6A-Nonhistone chromosomal protein related to mammalian HMG1 {ECO:0000313/EMBL:CCA71859.1} [Serendipita indica DSM 11827]CCA71859.1 NHP6A-Nonhistone chromosomal protein related to mammalian HMG1 [Serendipita indica DSM 11827]